MNEIYKDRVHQEQKKYDIMSESKQASFSQTIGDFKLALTDNRMLVHQLSKAFKASDINMMKELNVVQQQIRDEELRIESLKAQLRERTARRLLGLSDPELEDIILNNSANYEQIVMQIRYLQQEQFDILSAEKHIRRTYNEKILSALCDNDRASFNVKLEVLASFEHNEYPEFVNMFMYAHDGNIAEKKASQTSGTSQELLFFPYKFSKQEIRVKFFNNEKQELKGKSCETSLYDLMFAQGLALSVVTQDGKDKAKFRVTEIDGRQLWI